MKIKDVNTKRGIPERMYLIPVCLFFLSFTPSYGQQIRKLFQVDTAAKIVETDILKNLYIVTPGNAVLKYDSTGKFITSRQFTGYGVISSIDVTNPLNPEIFYSGQSKIIVSDDNLNIVSEVAMDPNLVGQFGPACRAGSGSFWIYDVQDARLKQPGMSADGPNLATLGIKDLNPVYITESSPWVYMSIPSTGIALFDQYGTYYKLLPIKNLSTFQVFKNTIVSFHDGSLFYYDIDTNDQKAVPLQFVTPEVINVRTASHRFWAQTKTGIICYVY